MITLSPLAYLRIAGAVAIVSGVLYIGYVFHDRSETKEALRKSNEDLATAKESLVVHIRNQELENWARTQYINELEVAKREKDRIEKCIADKSCVATVRVRIPATCPAGGAAGDSAGAESTSAALDPNTERRYFDLRDGIVSLEAKYGLCIQTLKNWQTKYPAN